MSNATITWNWANLLSAVTDDVADDKPAPAARQFWFPVLEQAIKAFAASAGATHKDLFERALLRVEAEALRLGFNQIAQASLPWRDPLTARKPEEWHDSLPVGLLVLVHETLETVPGILSARPEDLVKAWSDLWALLNGAAEYANNSDENWKEGQALAAVRIRATDAAEDRCYSWATVEWDSTAGAAAKRGMFLLPAVAWKQDGQPIASLFVPRLLQRLVPERATAGVWVPDPRTLIALHPPAAIDFTNETSRNVELEVPKLEVDELTRSAQLLSSYRFRSGSADDIWEANSLWNAALELDPPASDPNPDDSQWRDRQAAFNERLKMLFSSGIGGIAAADRELILAAIWSRRLRAIASNGLSYAGDGKIEAIGKVEGLGPSLISTHKPPADDLAASASPAPLVLHDQPLAAALYLAVRMGSAASGASARSLDISIGDVGSGVADFWARPQQVYVEVAKTVKGELRSDEADSPEIVAEASRWLHSARSFGFRRGRPMVGIDVFTLIDGATRGKLVAGASPGKEIAEWDVSDSKVVDRLKSEPTVFALLSALKKVYGNPRPGGLPAFVADLVSAGLKASSGAAVAGSDSPDAVEPSVPEKDKARLERLLRGFDDIDRLVCHLVSRAKANKESLTGSRDIVRMGRGRFIESYRDDARGFTPAVLSRVYSRAWSKTNARAQFIAATRSSQLPAPCKPSDETSSGATQKPADCGCEVKSSDTDTPQQPEGDFPDLAHLFGVTDVPVCHWGDSVHGPAAYLADVLEFLRHRRLVPSDSKNRNSISALDLLMDRRGDLAEIDLNDKNATVELPFIDLVNEVLERQVVNKIAFKVDVNLSNWEPKDNQPLEESAFSTLEESLKSWGVQLQAPVLISAVVDGRVNAHCRHERWMLRDRIGLALEASCLIVGSTINPWVIRLLPQTVLTSAELSAEPQFVERRAYDKLAKKSVAGSYALPWSLGETQVRQWLELIGVTSLEVLTIAPPGGARLIGPHGVPTAVSRLGLSQAEGSGLVFMPQVADCLLGPNRPMELTLSEFLQRSQATFEDVRAMQQTHFIGRKLGFQLVPVKGDECSADSTAVKVRWSDKGGASQTSKFLRLRKALEWTIADLDLALASPSIGDGKLDERATVRLAQFLEFRDRLGLGTHEALLVFTRLRTTALGEAAFGEWASVFLDTRVNCADPFADEDGLDVLRDLARPGNKQLTLRQRLSHASDERRKILELKVLRMLGASLRVAQADIEGLVEARFGEGSRWLDLNSESLGQLYGAVVLLRGIGVDTKGLRALALMVGGKPFEDPGEALELLDFQKTVEAATLSVRDLEGCLQASVVFPPAADAKGQVISPLTVMKSVLALHTGLRQMEQQGSPALLALGEPGATSVPENWWRGYLGLENGWNGTWSDQLSLLTEPVRRLLPRIKLAAGGLRQDGVKAFGLGRACFSTTSLLAEALDGIESLLTELPPENPVATEGKNELLRPDVARWIVKLFAPTLQWIGLPERDIQTRLQPWLLAEAEASVGDGQRQQDTATPERNVTALLASYLLCQPVDRFKLLQDRQAVLSAALSQALSTEEPQAWALLSATPAAASVTRSAATWWLELDLASLSKAWQGPSELSLEALGDDAKLKTAFAQIDAIHRFSRVTSAWDLDSSVMRWLFDHADNDHANPPCEGLQVLAPGDLFAEAKVTLAQLTKRWQRLASWAAAFKGTPDVEQPAAASGRISLRKDVLEPILRSAGLTEPDAESWSRLCRALDRLLGLAAGSAAELLHQPGNSSLLLKPSTLAWLKEVSDLLARTSVSIDELRRVVSALQQRDEGDLRTASGRLRAGLRKRFSDDAWLINVRKGQDRLREQKRDALVALLLSDEKRPWADNSGPTSADRLYEYLLLDTQMSACMTTSRIVQAHAVVQQFAQRCTMGLEAGWQIPANELVDWKQWKWMQSYRVWEACRKIFLYPENWMEPEVRDDKSRFFEELESDLNQGELTNENAELAFTRYLHKLHDVARLDVVATYYEFDANEPVMHVLARTPSEPYSYYYRQWVDERHWTPWDLVDLEIDSQHVVLFRRGGRLNLGWMTAKHEQDRPEIPSKFEAKKGDGDAYTVTGIEEPRVQWKLQLTTSQKVKEGWQPKRTSPGQLDWPQQPVAMSQLAIDNNPDRLQLTFQDYGVPEILVTASEPHREESTAQRRVVGSFSLQSCLGVAQAERIGSSEFSVYPIVEKTSPDGARQIELKTHTASELTLLEGTGSAAASAHPSILVDPTAGVDPTPGRFTVTPATQASLLDAAMAVARAALVPPSAGGIFTTGLGLPFFYSDDAVDIVVRVNFSTTGSDQINARQFSRSLAALRDALLTEEVQKQVWKVHDDSAQWARDVLSALTKAAPLVSAASIADLLDSVSRYDSKADGALPPFELAARTHHPMACELVSRAESRGIASVFNGKLQQTRREEVYRGRSQTRLSDSAINHFGCYALAYDDTFDAYAGYNWEVFFHAPFMIALKFASEAKFEDAMRWFHYIFDPIGVDEGASADEGVVRRQFWKLRPFRRGMEDSHKGHAIEVLLDPRRWGKEVKSAALQDLVDSIMAWRRKPNLPFQVARGRWSAFQKAVVYRYIDTLIAWGDARFRSDTREDITAASQLYVLAARLLGRRPRTDISMCDRGSTSGSGARSYLQLREVIDQRDDKLSAYLDSLLGEVSEITHCEENEEPDSPHLNFYNEYFCIPQNEKLFELWDRVADRLYKVRNCLNIDGVFRIPSLFAPPIDPALLARAGAAGLSFDQIMAGLNQPRSHYRFAVMLQKANEVAAELRTLGSELLQALEKRDAEELSLLRSRLDLQAIRLNKDIRDEQIKEAKTQLEAIAAQIANVQARQTWYLERIAKGTSPKELESIAGIRSGLMVRTRVAAMKSTAALATLIPTFTIGANGAFGSPHFAIRISGQDIAFAQNFFADKLAVEGDKDQTAAGITATLASYERRLEDWQLQRDMASGELLSLEKQRTAAEIRLSIALTEKRNLERSIESAEATDTFLKSKFTNSGLYDWMARQVSAVYYKTYQLASDYARAAEDCLNRELPMSQSGVKVVRADHWNGLRKGLLAATGLIHDLKRLEAEHLKRNGRVPELTKHVSLAVLDPWQLIELRATGKCRFKIPEVLFEMDHAGQVARRIKSVALSVPCVTGPYAGISCKLSLLSSSIKRAGKTEPEKVLAPAEAVFTSSGSNDSGQWEPSLRDDRYLPFEGAGAVDSEWELRLPAAVRQFDYATISDLVLHIRYTSEPGTNVDDAEDELRKKLQKATESAGPLWAYTSLRNDLSEQFALLARDQSRRSIRLKLPKEIARWMGQPVVPTGKIKVAVIGDATGGVSVRLATFVSSCKQDEVTKTTWSADLDLDPPKLLLDQSGFDLEIDGVSQLRDVVLCFSAALKQ
ncbi:neuraminidase-like domain-containing protein [Hydrogenophaga sp. RWCD_12]|uniref:Tc toxin subunit A-related protein n=1 Tax=Hydrogenophaga sp. RWCD_12 TaxID=3391190 RepID=UPI003984AA43